MLLLACTHVWSDTVTVGSNCTLDNALAYLKLSSGSPGGCTSVGSSGSSSSGSSSSGSTPSTTNAINLPAGLIQLTHPEVINGNVTIGGVGQKANADGSLGTSETRIVAPPGQRAFVFISAAVPVDSTSSPTATGLILNQDTLSGLSVVGGTATDDCINLVDNEKTPLAQKNGGAICSSAGLTLSNVDVRGSQATDFGGGIYVAPAGELTMSSVNVMGNSVTGSNGNGAGVYINNGLVTLNAVSIFDQCNTQAASPATAPAACPAGANDYALANVGLPGSGVVTNPLLWQNLTVASNQSGGIYDEAKLDLTNLTVAGNLSGISLPTQATLTAANYNFPVSGWLIELINSIVAGNGTAGMDCINFQTPSSQGAQFELLAVAGNVFSTTGGCPFATAADPSASVPSPLIGFDHVDANRNVILDLSKPDQVLLAPSPMHVTDLGVLAPIANYGGNAWTMKPRFTLDYSTRDQSPIIGRGAPTFQGTLGPVTYSCATTDARSFTRTTLCDIGADQYQFPIASGTLAVTGTEGQSVTANNLSTLLGDSDLVPIASGLSGTQMQWACGGTLLYGGTPLNQQAASTQLGCAWLVPDASTGGTGGLPTTDTRGIVSFDATTGNMIFTPAYTFHGVSTFNLRLTTTSTMFNADPNQRFVSDLVTVTEEPANGASSKTLGQFTAGGMGTCDVLGLVAGMILLFWRQGRQRIRGWLSLFLLVYAIPGQATLYIQVNTFDDQMGEDPAHCSLREAVLSNALSEDFGGCVYGDTILLPNGTYILTHGELEVQGSMTIKGYDITTDSSKSNASTIDPFTGLSPLRAPPTTTITSIPAGGTTPASRIAYVHSGGSLFLSNLILQGGLAKAEAVPDGAIPADGGIAFSRGALSLTNVEVYGGQAAGNGGAFALYGNNASLSLTNAYLHNNQASGCGGAAFFGPVKFKTADGSCSPTQVDLVNSCSFNGVPNTISFSSDSSTFYQNSAQLGASGLAFCGKLSFTMTNTTLEQQGKGAALSFMAISPGSTATIQNVTMTDNQTGLEIQEPNFTTFNLSNSILFWNATDCDYSVYGPGQAPPIGPSGARNNLFGSSCGAHAVSGGTLGAWLDNNGTQGFGTTASNVVTSPETTTPLAAQKSGQLIWVTSTQNPIDTLPFPMMLPSAQANMIIGQGSTSVGGCTAVDERGVSRTVPAPSGCDIGAGQRKRLLANNDNGGNTPQKPTIGAGRQVAIDILGNDEAPEEKTVQDLKTWGVTNVTGGCTWDPVAHLLRFDGSSLGDFGQGSKSVTCGYQLCGDTACSVLSPPAQVTISISNQPPQANDDTLYFLGNEPATVNVLANDYDQDGGVVGTATVNSFNRLNPNSVTIVGFPVTGSITCNPPGAATFLLSSTGNTVCPGGNITYQAFDNYGKFQDQFSYTVNDIDGLSSNTATVNILPKNQNLPWQGGGALGLDDLIVLSGGALLTQRRRLMRRLFQ